MQEEVPKAGLQTTPAPAPEAEGIVAATQLGAQSDAASLSNSASILAGSTGRDTGSGCFWEKIVVVEKLGKAGKNIYGAAVAELAEGPWPLEPVQSQRDESTQELWSVLESLESFELLCASIRQRTDTHDIDADIQKRAALAAQLVAPLETAVAAQESTVRTLEQRMSILDSRVQLMQENTLVSPLSGSSAVSNSVNLRAALEAGVQGFAQHFDVAGGNDVSALGGMAKVRVSELNQLAEQQLAMFQDILCGRVIETAAADERDRKQKKLLQELDALLDDAGQAYDDLVRVATQFIQAQHAAHLGAPADDGLSDTTMLAIKGLRLLETGAHNTVRGSQSLLMLLKKRMEHVKGMPDFAAQVDHKRRAVRKANKSAQKLRTKILAFQNRRQELLQFGEISSGEDDDVSDDEFAGTVEQMSAKLEELQQRMTTQLTLANDARTEMAKLLPWMPELRFDPLLTPPAAESQLIAASDMSLSVLSSGSPAAPVEFGSSAPDFVVPSDSSAPSPISIVRPQLLDKLGAPPFESAPMSTKSIADRSLLANQRTASPSKADIIAQRMTLEAHRAKLEQQLAEIQSKF